MKSSEFLNKNNPVTRQEMQNYLDGKLNYADKKSVEEKMVDDEFASEASEGFAENKVSFAELGALDAAWNSKSKSTVTSGTNYKYWFIGTAVVATLSIAAVLILMSAPEKIKTEYVVTGPAVDENNPENYPQLLAYLNRDQFGTKPLISGNYFNSENEAKTTLSDSQLKLELKNISNSKAIEKTKQITYEKTIASQPETQETKIPETVVIDVDPENVDAKKIEEIENFDEKKIVESNAKMLYIKNLKAVDYSDFYTNHIAKKEWLMTGITADKEDEKSDGAFNEQITKYIPYKEFLIESLTKFSKNDFKGSVTNLLIILQQYPDDINAAFYSGLCYYNLGKQRQAIAMFDKAISNSITTFREESEWYKCLSLIENGQREEAKVILKNIAGENGFYAKAAREKLKGMK